MPPKRTAKTVLVIEDERSLRDAISAKLQKEGFSVVAVAKIKEALDAMHSQSFDAVWLDHYLLGKENGLDLLVHIRSHTKERIIPVFVVTNTAGADKKKKYLALGVEGYYVKASSRLEDVVQNIADYLGSKRHD